MFYLIFHGGVLVFVGVGGQIALFLLDFPDDLELARSVQHDTLLAQQQSQETSYITTCQVHSLDSKPKEQ